MAGGRALAIANESFLMEPWPRWAGPSHGWGHINELPLCRYSLLKRGRLPPGPLICTKAYLARGALFIREQVVGINPSSSLPWYAVGRRPVDFPCGKQFHGHRFGLAPREGVGRRSSWGCSGRGRSRGRAMLAQRRRLVAAYGASPTVYQSLNVLSWFYKSIERTWWHFVRKFTKNNQSRWVKEHCSRRTHIAFCWFRQTNTQHYKEGGGQ